MSSIVSLKLMRLFRIGNAKNYLWYITELGSVCVAKKKYNKAIQYFEIGLERDPRSRCLNHNMGEAYAGLNNMETSIQYYDIAIEIDQDYIKPILSKAVVLYNFGHYKDALHWACIGREKAVDQNNTNMIQFADRLITEINKENI